MLVLAAGSDGSDGVTDDAGALVDGGTLARGEDGGYDAADCLQRADAAAFLEASGDLIHTGPTGTNVMDIIIGYKS
jgi:hydroxypyruvate reductase